MRSIAIGRLVERGREALLGGPHGLLAVWRAVMSRTTIMTARLPSNSMPAAAVSMGPCAVVEAEEVPSTYGIREPDRKSSVTLASGVRSRSGTRSSGARARQLAQVSGPDEIEGTLVGEHEAASWMTAIASGRQLDERAIALLRSAQLVHSSPPSRLLCVVGAAGWCLKDCNSNGRSMVATIGFPLSLRLVLSLSRHRGQIASERARTH